MAFKTENANHQGDYFSGLATFVGATCQATDDITKPLGDASESSVSHALDFVAGRSCTPISGGITTQAAGGRQLVQGLRPTAASVRTYDMGWSCSRP
jgi:hypothetical protein